MRPPVLSSWTTLWNFCIIGMLVVIGQPLIVESKPVRQPIDLVRCYDISRSLVSEVTGAISKLQDDLAGELNCSYESVAIEDVTDNTVNTVKACLPSMHSQDKCLAAIYSDLKLNGKELQGIKPSLDKTITDMMQALKVQDEDKEHGEKASSNKSSRSFKQCTVIHYFQLRTITIARVLRLLTGESSMQ